MDRRIAGAVLALFFLVVAVVMAYDLNSIQSRLPRFESEEIDRLQLWKITTLFAGGILAAVTAFVFVRPST